MNVEYIQPRNKHLNKFSPSYSRCKAHLEWKHKMTIFAKSLPIQPKITKDDSPSQQSWGNNPKAFNNLSPH